MQKITCNCGQDLNLIEQEPGPGQVGKKFVAFCRQKNCRKRWLLEDTKEQYEEMLMNECTGAENGEHQREDGLWYYKDGICME